MLETLEQNGFQEMTYDYSDIMKDRLVLFETIKNLIDKTTDNDPCIFTNAEVKVSENADNIYVSGSKSKIDLHKKERRQGNTKTIQAFVDLSNSPIKSTREEISFCNTPIQDTIIHGKMKLKRSIPLDQNTKVSNQSRKKKRTVSEIEKLFDQSESTEDECIKSKYIDMKGNF
jgi:hypothetical protein